MTVRFPSEPWSTFSWYTLNWSNYNQRPALVIEEMSKAKRMETHMGSDKAVYLHSENRENEKKYEKPVDFGDSEKLT